MWLMGLDRLILTMDRAEGLAAWTQAHVTDGGIPWLATPSLPTRSVVGLDGSSPGLDAAAWAARLSDEVVLVTGLDQPTPPLPGELGPPMWSPAAALKDAIKEIQPTLEEVLEGRKVERLTTEDGPVTALMDAVADRQAGLLTVGSTGKGRVARAYLGSVSEALIHHAPVPVLVARGRPGPGPVVAAVGDDQGSGHAAAWAVSLALHLDRDLVLATASRRTDRVEVVDQHEDGGARRLHVPWPPHKGIGELIEAGQPPLLVVGQSDRRHWFGSNATKLVRHASCSVLVARLPKEH